MKTMMPRITAGILTVLLFPLESSIAQQLSDAFYSSDFVKAGIVWNSAMQSPKDIKFNSPSGLTQKTFFIAYAKAFGLTGQNSFQKLNQQIGPKGQLHCRYKQLYKGVEVAGAQYLLHSENGMVSHANGLIVSGLKIDVTPSISEQQAVALANKYLGNISVNQRSSAEDPGDDRVNLMHFSQRPRLMISAGNLPECPENYHLVYRVDVTTLNPLGRYDVDIDARTGELVDKICRVYTENYITRGLSLYNDTVDIVVSDTFNEKVWQLDNVHWHPDTWMAWGGEGASWWISDTALFDPGGYNVLWYECLETDPVVIAGEEPELSFLQRYAVEQPSKTIHQYDGYDGLNVQVSADHGVTWQILGDPSPAYTCSSLFGFGYNFGEGPGVPGWSGILNEWTPASFDLSNYRNDTVLVRLVFCSDDYSLVL